MSFDDYVNHISKKYSLAIALAVIKSKPDNTTIEAYIKQLKQKVIDQNMDTDDLDITLCSDDFNIDDDNDITIFNDKNNDIINNDENHIIFHENDVVMDDTRMNDSITILNDFDDITGQKNEDNAKDNEFSNVFRMFTEVDENCSQGQQINTFNPSGKTQTDSQLTYCDVDIIDNNITFYKSIDLNHTQVITNDMDKTMNQDKSRDFGNKHHLAERNKSNNTNLLSEYVMRNESDNNIVKDTTQVKSAKIQDSGTKGKIKEIDTIDSPETIIYTLYGLTENCTHVSQSQNENLMISDKYIHGIGKNREGGGEGDTNEVKTHFDKPHTIEDNFNQINTSQNEIFTQNAQRFDDSRNNTQEFTKTNDCNEIQNVLENEQVIEEEISDSQVELIPFKVIEELSKVKGFLNRKVDRRMSTDGFSTDSGYKSDAQQKSAGKSASLSDTWVNQSAYSLYNFITVCSLMMNTQDINDEIAKVLGELIDKLHEEEKYPYFLEELLESVDLLLRRIYEEGTAENELLKKDESIQRLLLLNKSINIQKFCIEKISNILEEAHTNLMKDEEKYELLQINKIENLSYIFHILEIILKRYIKCKELASQSSQASQEEKLKRSSITDIWRKKWNPNYKEICVNEISLEKKCVLVKCSEVLNKIIVNCMESYSLIAYAALQCFNLLHS